VSVGQEKLSGSVPTLGVSKDKIRSMSRRDSPHITIKEAIDEIERIREELFALQRLLEKTEPVEAAVLSGENPKD
jgi:hypothetical protein